MRLTKSIMRYMGTDIWELSYITRSADKILNLDFLCLVISEELNLYKLVVLMVHASYM